MSREESILSRCAISLPLVAGVIAFIQSYRRWLDPIIDSGRDLYIPEQLRHGATLYQDILYYYPPLTPYLLAAITAFTGSGLSVYIAIGLATALLTAIAIWAIVQPLGGTYAASAALTIFFSFSMAGVGGWGCNYFFPYAHAATFAMLFFLWAVAMLLRDRWKLATLLLVAASWTKIEYSVFAVALLALHVAPTLLFVPPRAEAPAQTRVSVPHGWKAALLYAFSMVVTIAIAILVFGAPALRANILPPSLLGGSSARLFYAQVTGASAWQANLLLALRGAALIAVFVVLLRAWERRPRFRVIVLIGLAIAAWLLCNDAFFRGWTILQLCLVPFAIRKPRDPLALILLASLCASSRIYLNITPAWYGFVFVTPVVLLMVYVLFAWLPERGVYSQTTALAWLPLFVIVGASGLVAAHGAYANAIPVSTVRGTYYDTSAARANNVSELLDHLHRVAAHELVVMPEGLTLNYLARVTTPLRYQTFTPVEISGEEGPIVAELDARKPRYVVIVPRNVREFGYRTFGVDYGREILTWLRAHYEVEQRFGSILLLRLATTPRETPHQGSLSARTPAPTRK